MIHQLTVPLAILAILGVVSIFDPQARIPAAVVATGLVIFLLTSNARKLWQGRAGTPNLEGEANDAVYLSAAEESDTFSISRRLYAKAFLLQQTSDSDPETIRRLLLLADWLPVIEMDKSVDQDFLAQWAQLDSGLRKLSKNKAISLAKECLAA